jgi:hypothetical protein
MQWLGDGAAFHIERFGIELDVLIAFPIDENL